MRKLLLACFVFMLSACAGKAKEASAKDVTSSTAPTKDSLGISSQAFLKGQLFEMQGQAKIAQLFYSKALQFDPKSQFLHFRIAEQYLNMNLLDSAYSYARRGIEFNTIRKVSWNLLTGSLAKHFKNDSLAERMYLQVLEMDERENRALFELVTLYEEQKEYLKLLEYLGKLLPVTNYHMPLMQKYLLLTVMNKKPNLRESMLREAWTETGEKRWGIQLSQALVEHNKLQEGISVLYELVKTSPKDEQLTLTLANLERQAGHPFKSAEIIKSLYEPGENNVEYLVRAASVELEAGMTELAKKDLQEAIGRDSTSGFAWYLWSAIESQEQKWDSSMIAIERAIKIDSRTPTYQHQKALILMKQKKYDSSMVVMDELLKGPSANTQSALFQVSLISLAQGDTLVPNLEGWTKKQEVLRFALEMDSTSADLFFEYGAVLERSGELEASFQAFAKALSLDSNHHPSMNYWGYTLIDQNLNVDQGGELVERALVLDPNNYAYLDSKAWFLYRKENYEEALKILMKIYNSSDSGMARDEVLLEHIRACLEKLGQSEEAKKFLPTTED